MAHTVSAREANQRFSDILRRAAKGEAVVITRRGRPVAQLTSFDPAALPEGEGAAWDRLTGLLETGLSLGGATVDRDALHER